MSTQALMPFLTGVISEMSREDVNNINRHPNREPMI